MQPDKPIFLILSPGFASHETDTSCLPFQQTFVKALQKMNPGWEVRVLAFHYPHRQQVYQWEGIHIKAFGGANRGGLKRRLLWRQIKSYLNKTIAENRVAGMLCFWAGESSYIGLPVARKNKIPALAWIMGQDHRN
jgi:hypothetical protein